MSHTESGVCRSKCYVKYDVVDVFQSFRREGYIGNKRIPVSVSGVGKVYIQIQRPVPDARVFGSGLSGRNDRPVSVVEFAKIFVERIIAGDIFPAREKPV